MIDRRTFVRSAAILGASPMLVPVPGRAEAYPSKPVTIIVPFAAGQSGDVLARILSEPLGKMWGKSLIVENKVGAGGAIGSQFVAKAPGDGYTLLLGSSGPMAIAPNLVKNVGYDPRKDFTPIMNIAGVAQALVVPASSKYRSVRDLVADAKARPDKLSYGSGGNGSTQHLTMEMLKQHAGISMVHVPYKGTAPAYTDLIGGQLDVLVDSAPGVVPFLQSDKVRVLAVSTAKRMPSWPNVPTMAESGFPDFDVLGWLGIVAPQGLSPAIQKRLNDDLKTALANDAVKANLARLGMISLGTSPEEFGRYIDTELAKFGDVIRKGGITVE
ncbi:MULTISPECIES: Bug family tripartite tricarboxylate transporter substrate binding protein [Ramlibacter]|uniref:Tripartite tricarboxylate transporter substrate binding protein n=1 Tax=Ramlibacter pinisoli TaxID=2682844 RepID=A0A6N8IZA4_9BURK|nr:MULTISPECIES: tripartite tricarboxylate transporter substrate binding protein [Ramlibacter]MBA2962382.1 tripartite tricarboxylate transporter substrate binding protein [Ramlibacter sp. CGMCC 1.13660]MVQ32324.1 tripartite tricarboxylate transporter substrate binding protein [Ramlibacter pinisoli]